MPKEDEGELECVDKKDRNTYEDQHTREKFDWRRVSWTWWHVDYLRLVKEWKVWMW